MKLVPHPLTFHNHTVLPDASRFCPVPFSAELEEQEQWEEQEEQNHDKPVQLSLKRGCLLDPRKARLLSSLPSLRKYHLILDLDETLISACHISQEHSLVAALRATVPNMKSVIKECHVSSETFLVVERPHLQRFLDEMSALYTLHLHSNGHVDYVAAVLDLIDPQCRIPRANVVARKHMRLVPKSCPHPHLSIILDDCIDAWEPHCQSRVIPVSRFLLAQDRLKQAHYYVKTTLLNADYAPAFLDRDALASPTLPNLEVLLKQVLADDDLHLARYFHRLSGPFFASYTIQIRDLVVHLAKYMGALPSDDIAKAHLVLVAPQELQQYRDTFPKKKVRDTHWLLRQYIK